MSSAETLAGGEAGAPDEPTRTAPFQPPTIAGVSIPLVGREHELQLLVEQLYAVIDGGTSRLVTIVGAQGIGKSRLAHAFAQLVGRMPEPVALYQLHANRQHSGQPFSLLRLLVATLFRISEQDPPATVRARLERGVTRLLGEGHAEKAHFIGQLVGFELSDSHTPRGAADPRQLRDRALHYAMQCLNALSARGPMVLLIDDVHNADESSIDAISQFAVEDRGQGLLLVCLAQPRLFERRPGWGAGAARIDLGPLDERSSRRLVAEILRKAGKLPTELRNLIVSRSEGNPFFVEELIKMLIADGVIVTGTETWTIKPTPLARLRMPGSLAELLRARLQALPPAERDVLLRAAVVGRRFWSDAVATIGEPPATPSTAELLDSLQRRELIAACEESHLPGQHEFTFRHELMHEVAYAQVPVALREAYHRGVAAWLRARSGDRAGNYAGWIAEHYARGGQPHEAGSWYARAGHHARETYAIDEALRHYRAALDLLPTSLETAGERIACYEGLAELQLAIAHLTDAADSYTRMAEAAAAARDPVAEARAWNGLAFVQDHALDPRASRVSAERAIALAEQVGAPGELAMGLFHLAWAEIRLEAPQQALALGQRALAVLASADEPATTARWHGLLGVIATSLGDFEQAMCYQQQALDYHRAIGNLNEVATQLNNLAFTANLYGDYSLASTMLHEALGISREIGSRVLEIYILSNLGPASNGLGHYAAAEAEARRGIALSEVSRMVVFSEFYGTLAEACLGQGRVTEALEAAQQALDTARAIEGPREVAAAWRALGMAIAALSDPQGAPPCFAESARIFAELGARGERARTLRAWARHELRAGDAAHGHALWQEARALFAEAGLAHELARTPEEPR